MLKKEWMMGWSNFGGQSCLVSAISSWTAKTWKFDVCKCPLRCSTWILTESDKQSIRLSLQHSEDTWLHVSPWILGYSVSRASTTDLCPTKEQARDDTLQYPGGHDCLVVDDHDPSASWPCGSLLILFWDIGQNAGRSFRFAMHLHLPRSVHFSFLPNLRDTEKNSCQRTTLYPGSEPPVCSSFWRIMSRNSHLRYGKRLSQHSADFSEPQLPISCLMRAFALISRSKLQSIEKV